MNSSSETERNLPRPVAWSWDEMIGEFRALGGTADNIVQRLGQYGYGLFPIDPDKPVDIHVPVNLLVPTKWVWVDGPDLVIHEEADFDARTRAFFTRYQRAFSWGRDGRQSALSWFGQLESLPDGVRRYLRERMCMSLPDKLGEEHAFNRYIVTRRISYRDEMCLMPVIELINHDPYAPLYGMRDGIQVRGTFAGEVFACYSRSDSFRRYFQYGFVCDEKQAFSPPMTLPGVGGCTLTVGNETMATQGTGGVASLLPTVKNSGGGIEISHLLLGSASGPRIPRSIFRRVLPHLNPEQADEVFQRIVGYNIGLLVGLLDELDGHDCAMCHQLGRVVRLQLSGLASSYGVRDLESLPMLAHHG